MPIRSSVQSNLNYSCWQAIIYYWSQEQTFYGIYSQIVFPASFWLLIGILHPVACSPAQFQVHLSHMRVEYEQSSEFKMKEPAPFPNPDYFIDLTSHLSAS